MSHNGPQGETSLSRPSAVSSHYLSRLGVTFTYDSTGARGHAPVRPALFAPGTSSIRSSVLITLQDLLSGYMGGSAAGPTLDMRLLVHGSPPTTGSLHIDVRPLRIGGRIMVGLATLCGDDGAEFARGISTFLRLDTRGREQYPDDPGSAAIPLDELIGARVLDHTSIEFTPDERHRNYDATGAVQGGVQAYVAELCAEQALGGGRRMTATDLDIRFLTVQRSPQLVARAEVVATTADGGTCTVSLLDGRGSDRVTSVVTFTMRYAD
jgi:acyl-coenzyme A thioesterase PaaI-like protein